MNILSSSADFTSARWSPSPCAWLHVARAHDILLRMARAVADNDKAAQSVVAEDLRALAEEIGLVVEAEEVGRC